MCQSQRVFSIILESPQAHDPRASATINRAVIWNHEQLFIRSKLFDFWKSLPCFIRLQCDEHKRHKSRLFHQPVATANTEFALRIEQNVKSLHRAGTEM